VSVTETTGSMGQLQIMCAGGGMVLLLSAAGVSRVGSGVMPGGVIDGTGGNSFFTSCVVGALTQALVRRQKITIAAKTRTIIVFFRCICICMDSYTQGIKNCFNCDNIRSYQKSIVRIPFPGRIFQTSRTPLRKRW